MGAYLYCNKPSAIALARVETTADDGSTSTEVVEVALYRYACKPYSGFWREDEQANQRMRFASGAAACAAAWARSKRQMPTLGAFYSVDDGKLEISAPCESGLILTKGQPELLDDYAEAAKGCRVISWLRLPKGCVVREPALENRITRSCVLQVLTIPVASGKAFHARLCDEATGETSNGWWILRDEAALSQWALKLGVLAKPAPAGA